MHNLNYFRLLIGWFSLSLLCFSGCKNDVHPSDSEIPPAGFADTVFNRQEFSFEEDSDEIELNDSIVSMLKPILLSDPGRRRLDNWFDLKSGWIDILGDVENLIYYASRISDRVLSEGDLSSAAKVKFSIGRFQYLGGNYTEAITYTLEALELAKQAEDSITMGWSFFGLSGPLIYLKDFETAGDYLNRAIEIGQKLNEPAIEASGKSGLVGFYVFQDQLDTALVIAQEVLKIVKEEKLVELEKIFNVNYSFMLILNGEVDKAIVFLKQNIAIQKDDVSIPISLLHLNLYEAYMAKEKLDEAIVSLQRGCEMADSLDFGFGISFCKQSFSTYYELIGNYQLALSYRKEYQEINEKQLGEKANLKLNSLTNRQRIREKDWEIERLQQVQAERNEKDSNRRRNMAIGATVLAVLVLGGFAFIQVRHRIRSVYQSKTIAETKLQVLQSQMNPHFIYNSIAGIQNYILKSEKIEAYSYLGKFASLLRMITKSANSFSIKLEQEVAMIRTYLDLEKLRFREAFDYELIVEQNLLEADLEIPSMMIQPVLENAVLHGLSGLSREGKITISIKLWANGVVFVVTDNGKGRVEAAQIASQEPEFHLSIATVNIEARIKFLQEIGYFFARTEIEDLYEKDVATGTRVSVYLPVLT